MEYDNEYVSFNISSVGNGVPFPKIRIQGTVKNPMNYEKVEMIASNPPMSMTNYSGSGLPYPCADVAFDNTPNRQEILRPDFNVEFVYPNSYYVSGGTTKIKPSIFFSFLYKSSTVPTFVRFELEDILPLKTLTHRPERTGPEFYSRKADIVGVPPSQEYLLQNIANIKTKYGVA